METKRIDRMIATQQKIFATQNKALSEAMNDEMQAHLIYDFVRAVETTRATIERLWSMR